MKSVEKIIGFINYIFSSPKLPINDFLNNLPVEIIDKIFQYLDDKTLKQVCLVNKNFKQVVDGLIKIEIEKFKKDDPGRGDIISYLSLKTYFKLLKDENKPVKVSLNFFRNVKSLNHPNNFSKLFYQYCKHNLNAKLLLAANTYNFDFLGRYLENLENEEKEKLASYNLDENIQPYGPLYIIILYAKFINAQKNNDKAEIELLKEKGMALYYLKENKFMELVNIEPKLLQIIHLFNNKALQEDDWQVIKNSKIAIPLVNYIKFSVIYKTDYSEEEKIEVIKKCLELGANVNSFTNPFIKAIEKGYFEIAKFLHENHVDINNISPIGIGTELNFTNPINQTNEHLGKGACEFVKYLIDNKVSVKEKGLGESYALNYSLNHPHFLLFKGNNIDELNNIIELLKKEHMKLAIKYFIKGNNDKAFELAEQATSDNKDAVEFKKLAKSSGLNKEQLDKLYELVGVQSVSTGCAIM